MGKVYEIINGADDLAKKAGDNVSGALKNAKDSKVGQALSKTGSKMSNIGEKISENSNDLTKTGASLLDQSAMDDQRTRELANAMVNGMMVDAGGNSGSALDGLENAIKGSTRAATSMCLAWVTYCSSQGKMAFSRVATTGASVLPILGIGTLRAIAKSRKDSIGGFDVVQYQSAGNFLGKSYLTNKVDFDPFILECKKDASDVMASRHLLGFNNDSGAGSKISEVLEALPKKFPDTDDSTFGTQYRQACGIASSSCALYEKQIVEALLNANDHTVDVKLLGALGNGSNADKLKEILENPNTKSPIGKAILNLRSSFQKKISDIGDDCTAGKLSSSQALEGIQNAVKERMNDMIALVVNAGGVNITDVAEFTSLHADKFRNMSDEANKKFEQKFFASDAWRSADVDSLETSFSEMLKNHKPALEASKKELPVKLELEEKKVAVQKAVESYTTAHKNYINSTDLKQKILAKSDAECDLLKAELTMKATDFNIARQENATKAMSGKLTKEDIVHWKGLTKEEFVVLGKSDKKADKALYKDISDDLDKKLASINGKDTPNERIIAFYKEDQRSFAELVDSGLSNHYVGGGKGVREQVDMHFNSSKKELTEADRVDCLQHVSERHIQIRADLNEVYLSGVGDEFKFIEGKSLDSVGKAELVKSDLLKQIEEKLKVSDEFAKDPDKLTFAMKKVKNSICVIGQENGTADLVVDLKALPKSVGNVKLREEMKKLCDSDDYNIGIYSGDITKFNNMFFAHAVDEIKEILQETKTEFKDARFSLNRDKSGALHVSTFASMSGSIFAFLQGKGIKGEKTDVLEGRIYEETDLLKLAAKYGQDVKRVTLPSSQAMHESWSDKYNRNDSSSPVNAVKDIYSRIDFGSDRQSNVSIAFSKNSEGGWDLLCTGSYERVGQWLAGALKGHMPDMGAGGFKIGQPLVQKTAGGRSL